MRRPFRPIFFKLIGRLAVPCSDMEEWARWRASVGPEGHRVAHTDLGLLWISTIFLGIDHNFGFGPTGDAVLFETMVFGDDETQWQTRCDTWDEAQKMHAAAVEYARGLLAVAQGMLSERREC